MQDMRKQAERLFRAGVAAADPVRAVRAALARRPLAPPPEGGVTHVIAVGKAARGMAAAALPRVPAPGRALVVTNPENARPLEGAEVMAAGHPVPDEAGRAAARAVIALLGQAGARDRILALISGGGSALLPAPVEGITLGDKAEVNRLLLASGADIHAMNLVRQQLSRLKGGGFLALAAPAGVRALLISDVIGDDARVIASGLTAPPLGTRAEARALLERLGVWEALPEAVRAHLERPAPPASPLPEADNEIIASNAASLAAMACAARSMGASAGADAHVRVFPAPLTGDVADAARRIMDFAGSGPGICLFGGETTVRLGRQGGEPGKGAGRGGRNQELALRLALLAEAAGWRDYAFLSGGTDGRDGPTDAAGGLVDAATPARIRAAHVDPQAALARNDSYHALKAAGDLLITGPTGTNVADLQVLIRR